MGTRYVEKLPVISVRPFVRVSWFYADVMCAVGKTLAYTSVRFINKDNDIVARGSHTKYVSFAWKDEKNIVEELKPEIPESKVV